MADEAALPVPQDAAVAARLRHPHREHGHRGPAGRVPLEQGVQGAGAQQRRVAADDQQGAVEARQRRAGHAHGVAGAALLGLDHPLDPGPGERLHHALALVPDHREHAVHAELAQRVEHPGQQRAAGHGVEHLGQVALHARALPGGQHQGRRPGMPVARHRGPHSKLSIRRAGPTRAATATSTRPARRAGYPPRDVPQRRERRRVHHRHVVLAHQRVAPPDRAHRARHPRRRALAARQRRPRRGQAARERHRLRALRRAPGRRCATTSPARPARARWPPGAPAPAGAGRAPCARAPGPAGRPSAPATARRAPPSRAGSRTTVVTPVEVPRAHRALEHVRQPLHRDARAVPGRVDVRAAGLPQQVHAAPRPAGRGRRRTGRG